MFKSKYSLVALLLAFTLILLTGCGSAKTPEATGSAASSAPAKETAAPETAAPEATANANEEAFEISVAHWMLNKDNANAGEYMKQVELKYKATYPNAKIVWNPIQGEKYHELLKAQLATKSAPDVFFHQNALVAFAKAGFLADLSDQAWASHILPSALGEVKYGGKVYGVPVDVSGWGVFYNKKVFADLGLTAPKTFQEFLDLSEKIKAAGITPVTSGYKDGWPIAGSWFSLINFVFGADPDIAKHLFDGTKKINGPEFKSMFAAYEAMVKKGVISKSILSTTYDLAVQQVAEGKAAMHFNGPWVNSFVADKYKVDLGFFTIPDDKGTNFVTSATNATVSLNANYPNKERGQDMINALIDPAILAPFLENSAFSGLDTFIVKHKTTGGQEYSEAIGKQEGKMQPSIWLPPSVTELLNQMTTKISSGKSVSDDDLDAADKAYQRDKGLLNIE
ncbi:extracellular solute-binding protein [Paenibacillus psychroresistens]|uniref:Extracellular solute-binding protein n=1 Tax=Paenibacillus psychroresistens TaxID=1778678 RepID=A0A6B8RT98_9BACL|nr:extracellular solute-binding protein [Paenibacillus psychroresistens]QGQ98775.1 extracellular solute-binding protein [Paenibacillus psychroresistens]